MKNTTEKHHFIQRWYEMSEKERILKYVTYMLYLFGICILMFGVLLLFFQDVEIDCGIDGIKGDLNIVTYQSIYEPNKPYPLFYSPLQNGKYEDFMWNRDYSENNNMRLNPELENINIKEINGVRCKINAPIYFLLLKGR